MKARNLEFNLVHAAPKNNHIDTAFTDKVMAHLPNISTFSTHIHGNHQPSMWYRFRHLPKFAMVLLALAALFIASTVTYAVIETIKQTNNVHIEKSGVNEFGREQLSVNFDSCAEGKDAGTTYELKKDSGLSAEDGAKVLQARCDFDVISSWLRKDPVFISQKDKLFFTAPEMPSQGVSGTLNSFSKTDISLHVPQNFIGKESDRTFPLPEGVRFVEGNKEIARNDIKPGDSLLYFSPSFFRDDQPITPEDIVVFKLSLPPKYYGTEMRSYVRVRSACDNNPTRTCVQDNSINTVFLLVSHGGAWIDPGVNLTIKSIQGKVVSWDNTGVKLDVGDGVIYTLITPSNIIDTYNNTTVYGLKSLDTIYSKTDPEVLKIRKGDNLEIAYKEDLDKSSPFIEWSQNLTIALMVERRVDDISVLRKY